MTDPTSVALSWEQDFDAWLEAQHEIRWRRVLRSRGLWMGAGMGGLGLLVAVSATAAVVMWGVLALGCWAFLQRWWIRRSTRGRREGLPLGRWTWHLSEDAIRCHQVGIRWVVPWTSIRRIESTPSICLFWLSSGEALHMPSGALTPDVKALLARWHLSRTQWSPPAPESGAPWVLEFDRSVEDAVDMTRGIQPQISGLRKLWRVGLATFVGVLGLFQLWIDIQVGPRPVSLAASSLLLGLSALLLIRFTPVSRLFWRMLIRWITRGDRGGGILGKTVYAMDVDGIHVIRGLGESRLSWTRIHSVRPLSSGCLIRLLWGAPLWIPSRVFSDAEDQNRCVEQMRSWIRLSRPERGSERVNHSVDSANPFAPPVD